MNLENDILRGMLHVAGVKLFWVTQTFHPGVKYHNFRPRAKQENAI